MPSRVGQQLGHYLLMRLLGQGGFAEVYLGEHVSLRTQAAIKVVRTQLIQDEAEEFLKEARTVAHLIHPHIVRIFDFEVQQSTPFLVMDYAPNGTLRQRHPKATQVPLPIIVNYVKQVADALQYAHDQKLIHRDIKPENMLIGRLDEILLSDFGIALVAQSTLQQSTQGVVGTPYYMAPEQLQGKPRFASDQYSLGIVVYEWLTGDRPFKGAFSEVANQHMHVPPPSLSERNPQISPDVEQVVMMALSKDPHQRFATISAFANALEQASRSPHFFAPFAPTSSVTLPVKASPQLGLKTPSALPPVQYDVVNPQSFASGATTSPGQLSSRTYTVTPTQLPSPITPLLEPQEGFERPLDRNPVKQAESVPSDDLSVTKKGISRRAAIGGLSAVVGLAIAGSGIAWVVLSQKPATSTRLKSALGTTLSIYRRHASWVYVVGWSPDGTRVASGAQDKTVQVWNATTGGNVLTYNGQKASVFALAWSPDGTRIVSGGQDNTAQVWDANQARHILTYTAHTSSVNALSWSPNSTYIASASADFTVRVWNASDKRPLFTFSHLNNVRAVAWSPDGRYIASAGDDKIVQVRDASSGTLIYAYRGHAARVWKLAWSPNSKRIVSAGEDRTAQVWNATNGGNVITYKGHSDNVTTVDWWSSFIASGSTDKTIQIWNASSGTHIYTYTQHTDVITSLRWSPTGTYVASASGDTTVRVWQAVPVRSVS